MTPLTFYNMAERLLNTNSGYIYEKHGVKWTVGKLGIILSQIKNGMIVYRSGTIRIIGPYIIVVAKIMTND